MIQRPRGTRDFLPDEMERRRHYESLLRETAQLYGFREVATPMFENTELFTTKSGPNIVDEIYSFQDKGGREISLRPELTAPVMRMFVNELSNAPRPLKLFYFGQCFRYERPQSGRYREFFQFGAEIIGAPTAETDAEAIALAEAMIKRLGLKNYVLRVGHIGILREKLSGLGVPQEGMAELLQKLDKKLYDEARSLMEAYDVSSEGINAVFEFTALSGGKDLLSRIEGEAGAYLRELFSILELYGVEAVQLDLGTVRGLDYYTGVVFEVEAPSLGAEKQVCGGGSYTLSELLGGESVFSTGFAIGFDRILLALEKEGANFSPQGLDAYVLATANETRPDSFRIVTMLRKAGLRADVDLMRRKLSKAMKQAAASRARYAVIVGARDLAENAVTVREMSSGEQRRVSLDELVSYLSA
ncbi:MAG: histidyl-tRNA synthetase [Candidatus Methanomethylophilaceae archaeon]|nr:histidyl-tRNA synthetase [Candidatus Methanomethylophilaceae archaeon]MDI3542386.1 histidyl-tRNA synthetase [Candidatus Methanomethylophilaceae archaeon]